MRNFALKLVASACLLAGCSGTSSVGTGPTGSSLDGTWDVTSTGGGYDPGVLVVNGRLATLTSASTSASVTYVVTVQIAEGYSQATVSSSLKGFRDTGATYKYAHSGSGLDGDWKYSAENVKESSLLTISGSSFVASSNNSNLSGTLGTDGKTLSGSGALYGHQFTFVATRR